MVLGGGQHFLILPQLVHLVSEHAVHLLLVLPVESLNELVSQSRLFVELILKII